MRYWTVLTFFSKYIACKNIWISTLSQHIKYRTTPFADCFILKFSVFNKSYLSNVVVNENKISAKYSGSWNIELNNLIHNTQANYNSFNFQNIIFQKRHDTWRIIPNK